MTRSSLMKRVISTEYLIMAVLVALFYVVLGKFDWWWLVVLFPVFFVASIGYGIGPVFGAWLYNLINSLLIPAILLIVYIVLDERWALFLALIWLFHIFVNRALGYGLKHRTDFKDTHLGTVSPRRKISSKKSTKSTPKKTTAKKRR